MICATCFPLAGLNLGLKSYHNIVYCYPTLMVCVLFSHLQTGFVESVGDVVTQGQEVEVRVLSVDVQKNRVALSMKEVRN